MHFFPCGRGLAGVRFSQQDRITARHEKACNAFAEIDLRPEAHAGFLTKRFELHTDAGSKESEVQRYSLRMTPKPVYQYGREDGDIVDAAVFMWSRGTDPDAVLLIESHRDGEELKWRCGIFPVSIYALDAKLDGSAVWSKPRAMVFNGNNEPPFAGPFRRDRNEASIKQLLP